MKRYEFRPEQEARRATLEKAATRLLRRAARQRVPRKSTKATPAPNGSWRPLKTGLPVWRRQNSV
jgi:hypothetical protein